MTMPCSATGRAHTKASGSSAVASQLKPSLQPAHPGGGLLCSCRRCSHACSPTSIGTVGSPIELCSSLTEMRPSRARCTATSWASTCGSVSTGRHGAHRIARRAGTWRGVVHCGEPGADLVDGCGAEVAQWRTPPQPAQLGAQRCNERDARRRVWLQLSRRGMEHLAELPSTRAAAQTALDLTDLFGAKPDNGSAISSVWSKNWMDALWWHGEN